MNLSDLRDLTDFLHSVKVRQPKRRYENDKSVTKLFWQDGCVVWQITDASLNNFFDDDDTTCYYFKPEAFCDIILSLMTDGHCKFDCRGGMSFFMYRHELGECRELRETVSVGTLNGEFRIASGVLEAIGLNCAEATELAHWHDWSYGKNHRDEYTRLIKNALAGS